MTPEALAIGVTLNSGVVNCSRFELPPPLRFKIGVVVTSAGFFLMILNSIRSFVLDATPAAIADAVEDDGAVFVLIAILLVRIQLIVRLKMTGLLSSNGYQLLYSTVYYRRNFVWFACRISDMLFTREVINR